MSVDYMNRTCDIIMETHEEYIRIRSGIERLMLPVSQSYGLTPTQVAVLNLIKKTDNATVSKLFRTLDFNQGNMSSMCKKLEADGFIEKTKSTDDERKCFLTLTGKGETALSGIDKAFDFTPETCWLTREEVEEAEAAILILRNTANKINKMLAQHLSERNVDDNA